MPRTSEVVAPLLCGLGVVGLAALPGLVPAAPTAGTVALALASLAGLAWTARAGRSSPQAAPPQSTDPEVELQADVPPPPPPRAKAPAEVNLLANLSHEIRTPLNGVVSTAHLLADTPLNQEQRALVQTLETSGNNLLDLINDILDFSKAEAGEIRLERRSFSVQSLVGELNRLFAAQAQAKGLTLVGDVDPTLPESITGDPARLRQVLSNLVSNAIKFTKRGDVTIEVEREANGLVVRVCDTGIGIPEEAQQRVFQSYQQADSATPRVFGGTGLGLAICKKLVGLMGSDLAVDSVPGEGSTFWFRIPLDGLEAHTPPQLPPGRVLVVDGSTRMRTMLRRTLTARGMEVDEASDGLEALQLALHAAQLDRPHSVLLVDAGLEGVSGPLLARMFRREEELADVRIVLMCHHAERPRGAELASLSMESIDKPVQPEALAHLLSAPAGSVPLTPRRTSDSAAERAQPKRSLGTVAPVALAQHVTQPASPPDEADGDGPCVLLVDDNGFNQMLIQMQLKKLGCRVRVAANGLAGVNTWQSGSYDLVLMDLQMPEMNGFEAAREIRRREEVSGQPRTPIVAVTADTCPQTRERCLEAGMDDRLTKPIIVDQLRSVVDGVRPRMEMSA